MSAEKLLGDVWRGYPRLSHSRHAFYCVPGKDKLRRGIFVFDDLSVQSARVRGHLLQWSGGPWRYALRSHNAYIIPFLFITPRFGRHFSTGPVDLWKTFFFLAVGNQCERRLEQKSLAELHKEEQRWPWLGCQNGERES